ncbi:MAG: tetratricopeptide repeat protein [Opitutales bacterium]|nr:tetratricopeptide repeat protein [Opitutales bacterium]
MKTDPHTLFEFARKIHQSGHDEAAVTGYQDLLQLQPDFPHARYLLAVALTSCDRAEEALPHIQAHLKNRMDHPAGWVTLGDCYARQQKISEAASAYQEALRREPKNLDAALGIGNLLADQEKWSELEEFTDSLRKIHQDSVAALRLKSLACERLEDFRGALIACARYSAKFGSSKEIRKWANVFLKKIRHPDEELLKELEAVGEIAFKVMYYRACLRVKQRDRALKVLTEIREEDPEYQHLRLEFIADSLQNAEFNADAEPYHWELIRQDPFDDKRLIRLIENTLKLAKGDQPEKYQDACELAKILMERTGASVASYSLMASIYMNASRPELALPYYDYVIEREPNSPLASPYLFNLNYDENRNPEEVFKAHCEWGRRFSKRFSEKGIFTDLDRRPNRQLRIGYLSPDLGQHPCGYFSIGVFKEHNPEEVEVFLYSNRYPETMDDKLSKQFRAQVGEDHWRWTRELSTEKLTQLIQNDQIDILVEMAGHTGHNRLDALASRAAPIQVTWLGYANTTGLEEVDYRLSDEIIEPEGEADTRSTEKIYRLPNGFHMFQLRDDLPAPADPPCLKRGYITFGSYNNMNKLGSRSIELWAKLLKRVPESKILLKHKSLAVLDNRETLRSLFAMHGIQAHRVILKTTTRGMVEHYKSYGEMDIALDPLAYNGTTTSCDALSMGVPVLTLPGETHASRVTASLLHRVGLDQWAAQSEQDYLRIGTMAAQNPAMLKKIRHELPGKFRQSPLGDGAGMARDLENAYRDMWKHYCKTGRPPLTR